MLDLVWTGFLLPVCQVGMLLPNLARSIFVFELIGWLDLAIPFLSI